MVLQQLNSVASMKFSKFLHTAFENSPRCCVPCVCTNLKLILRTPPVGFGGECSQLACTLVEKCENPAPRLPAQMCVYAPGSNTTAVLLPWTCCTFQHEAALQPSQIKTYCCFIVLLPHCYDSFSVLNQ